jgi:hypothetical protein
MPAPERPPATKVFMSKLLKAAWPPADAVAFRAAGGALCSAASALSPDSPRPDFKKRKQPLHGAQPQTGDASHCTAMRRSACSYMSLGCPPWIR